MYKKPRMLLACASVCALTLAPSGAAMAKGAPDECEFPAQDLKLLRDAHITNSAPQVREAVTDACGNATASEALDGGLAQQHQDDDFVDGYVDVYYPYGNVFVNNWR